MLRNALTPVAFVATTLQSLNAVTNGASQVEPHAPSGLGATGRQIGNVFCQLHVLKNYEIALVPEMKWQVKQWPTDCTVAWNPNVCWLQGHCPEMNRHSDMWWSNGCGVRTPSISMGRHRDGDCWVQCSKWTQQTAMAHNCIWQEKNGVWQIWGSPSDSKSWCPGCNL